MTSWKEKLKTVLEMYNMEIHQMKIGPDYHRLKTMVFRSIEQDLRNRNFGARNGKYERNAVLSRIMDKTAWTENLEIVGNGETNGQCSEGDNCSFRHDVNKPAKKRHTRIRHRVLSWNRKSEMRRESEVPEARVPVVECLDAPARFTSQELAPIHSLKSGILQNACSTRPRVVADLEKSALMRIVRLMNSLAKGSRRMVTKVQWPCWRSMNHTIELGDPLCATHQVHDKWVA